MKLLALYSILWISFISKVESSCSCDVIKNNCDNGCCCDVDCSVLHRRLFTSCEETVQNQPFEFCKILNLEGFTYNSLCIYSSNKNLTYPLKGYSRMKTTDRTMNNYVSYATDFPVQISYGKTDITQLVVPRSTGDTCRMKSVGFGQSFVSYCEWIITSAQSMDSSEKYISCNRLSDVFLSSTNSTILSKVKPNEADNTRIIPSVTCYDNYTKKLIECPKKTPTDIVGSPSKLVCSRVPTLVYIKITYEVIGLITGMEIYATIGDVPEAFMQKYEVEFVQANASGELPLSGNPGYLIGHPIVGAKLNKTDLKSLGYSGSTGAVTTMIPTTNIKLSIDGKKRKLSNGVWSILAGGRCGEILQDRGLLVEPIRFGEDVFSGCTLSLSSFEKLTRPEMDWTTLCVQYQNIIWQTLLNPLGVTAEENRKGLGINFISSKPDSIAIWPISKTNRSSEWIPIQNLIYDYFPLKPRGLNGYCYQLLVGQDIEIQYARYGSMKLPQNQIVGARSNYIYGDVFLMKPNVNIEITQRVRFVDVTPMAETREKLLPYFLLRLPSDFFYPFA
ncbi:unnamed protein product [Heterobilharzia americana]|nr:unnamed protein product [Heterobilharzia americana]